MQVVVQGTREVIAAFSAKQVLMHEAVAYSVEEIGFMWERVAKLDTTGKGAVVTGRFRASLGHFTAEHVVEEGSGASGADAVWIMSETAKGPELIVGTNVDYAKNVEEYHSIFADSMDETAPIAARMVQTNLMAVLM